MPSQLAPNPTWSIPATRRMWFKCAEKRKLALEPTVFKPRIFLCLTDDILDSGMVTASQKVGEKVDHNKPFFLSLKYKEIIFVIVHFSTATSFAIAVLQGTFPGFVINC